MSYNKATIDFNSPESVVMAITDYVEFNKETLERAENLAGQIEELREELAELRSECNDWENQANYNEKLASKLDKEVSDLKERILQLGGGSDLV